MKLSLDSATLRRWGFRVLIAAGVLFVTFGLVLGAAVAWFYPQLPTLDKVTDYQPRQPLQVLTIDGVEIAQFGAERRRYVPIESMPKLMQDALLAVEDTRFREHSGIDPKGVLRALFANLTGGLPQGASTITQQVARTFFLSARRTPERKIKEALLALQIEARLPKDKILELYMNQIYLGQRTYGFAAAAQTYFGKTLEQLTIAEAAMLAGLPQNPAYANPMVNFDRAVRRQHVVLARMRAVGMIDDAQLAQARAEKPKLHAAGSVDLHAEHVAEMARALLYQRFGEAAYSQGMKVTTSLRASDQRAAYAALRKSVLAHDRRQPYRGPEDFEALPANDDNLEQATALALKDSIDDADLRVAIVTHASPGEVVAQLATGETIRVKNEGLRWARLALQPKAHRDLAIRRGSIIRVTRNDRKSGETLPTWAISQWPEADGAFISMDPANGRVRALVGGFDFTTRQFNHVTQAWRQPGSSFKPFLYSAAIEHGVMPGTLINDAPLFESEIDNAGGPHWNPRNSDGMFDGAISLRQALAKSKNLVSIRLVQLIGTQAARDWTARFGFDADKQPDNLTLALGAGSVTPMQMAGAYAVLANGGHRVAPVVIERVTDASGRVLFEAPSPSPLNEASRVIPARNAFIANSLLQEVVRSGTAARAQAALRRPDLFGKTGTTNEAVDAWFAGFQPGLVAVAWMGYDNPQSLGEGESGGGLALPMWIDYMQQALKGMPVQDIEMPEGVAHAADGWTYSEFTQGGRVERVGFALPPAEPSMPAASGVTP